VSSVKKESSSPAKGSGKRKNEPHLSKIENKKVKLDKLESDEGIIKHIAVCWSLLT
jgi:hypothetical protein